MQQIRVYLKIMRTFTDKQKRTIRAGLFGAILLFAILCVSCGRGPAEDPAVSLAETVSTDPAVQTDPVSPDRTETEPKTQETSSDVMSDPDVTQDSQVPPPEDTAADDEVTGETEGEETQDNTPSAPSPTYEEYSAMTSQEQLDFFNSFADIEGFFLWFEQAKADYEERHPGIEIGPGGVIIP